MKPFYAFQNESDELTIGNLVFDNHTDCVSVSGDVDVTLDQSGLLHARALQAQFAQILAALEAADRLGKLPEAIERKAATPAGNLFGLPLPK